jgi:hypothetical protein
MITIGPIMDHTLNPYDLSASCHRPTREPGTSVRKQGESYVEGARQEGSRLRTGVWALRVVAPRL